jgi:tryptophan 2,3-dioxygenase
VSKKDLPAGAKTDFSADMSYGDYLDLGRVLAAQHPRSDDHNEMLFIIQHQTSELWIKLMLHELRAAIKEIANSELSSAFKMMARVSRIFEQLVHSWDVLATMTPSEYTRMRPSLGSSSGFQSHQYREIEFLLGNKNDGMLRVHAHQPETLAVLEASLRSPSLYDESIRLLARRGFAISTTERDYALAYQPSGELIDLEDAFRQWRFRHVTTVERIIGFKPGTGGTAGVSYLRKMLDVVLFPELWKVRTDL